MQRVHNELVKRQATVTAVPTASGISGGETASSVDVGTSLLLGVSGSSTPSVSNLVITQTGTTSTSSSTPDTTSTSSSSTHSPSVSTGSVVAIMIAVFLVLIGAMFVVYKYFKKRIASRVRHPLSRGPPLVVRGTEGFRDYGRDKQRNNDDDRGEGKSNASAGPTGVRGKSLDSAKFGLFEKDPSIRSLTDEKANVSDDHFDPSTMATFVKYQADPADDLPLPRPLVAHEEGSPTVSWDGRTVIGDPFRSLHASVSDNMSPTAVIARQTPQTTDSAQHRWESAEVVMMDEATTDTPDASQNPFDDDSAPRESTDDGTDTRSGTNPFFNAAQHNPFADRSTRSRNSSVSTAKRSRSYSISSGPTVPTVENENTLLSLLAALHPTPVASDEQTNCSSVYTTATSLADVDPEPPQAF